MIFSEKITFVLFAYNEAARIERAVKNFIGAGRVLVIDNHSTDATRQLAEISGAEVVLHKNPGWVEDEGTAQVVKNQVTTPWIYWGYCDESVDATTLNAVLTAVESGKWKIISLARKNYYYGTFCHGAYASRTNRIFEKNSIDFTQNRIHNFGKIVVSENQILNMDAKEYCVHHFISYTAKTYIKAIDGYTDVGSSNAIELKPSKLLLHSLRTFVGNYWVRGGYRAGRPGLFLGLQMMYYPILEAIKHYERAHQLSVENIEERNNQQRDRILMTLRQSE